VPENEVRALQRVLFASSSKPNGNGLGWAVHPGDSDEQKAVSRQLAVDPRSHRRSPTVVTARRTGASAIWPRPRIRGGTLVGPAFRDRCGARRYQSLRNRSAQLAQARSTGEYNTYLIALAQFSQANLAARTIALVDAGKVRQQEYPLLFGVLLANTHTQVCSLGLLERGIGAISPKRLHLRRQGRGLLL